MQQETPMEKVERLSRLLERMVMTRERPEIIRTVVLEWHDARRAAGLPVR